MVVLGFQCVVRMSEIVERKGKQSACFFCFCIIFYFFLIGHGLV